ncbi:hypothetical protein EUBDOL_00061 [Amedibacillus dolichus DSM 3991]|uniref:Uncharacterized protein n=1 Tax=Amedibacillus dolichus DSM 3991 TaxID=428127 RepID=A8R7T0_9FIRM|nr:hypothetical protein EUBDOL_00061 [Amedibacillus dolichus DSM 3991]
MRGFSIFISISSFVYNVNTNSHICEVLFFLFEAFIITWKWR